MVSEKPCLYLCETVCHLTVLAVWSWEGSGRTKMTPFIPQSVSQAWIASNWLNASLKMIIPDMSPSRLIPTESNVCCLKNSSCFVYFRPITYAGFRYNSSFTNLVKQLIKNQQTFLTVRVAHKVLNITLASANPHCRAIATLCGYHNSVVMLTVTACQTSTLFTLHVIGYLTGGEGFSLF